MLSDFWKALTKYLEKLPYWSTIEPFFLVIFATVAAEVAAYQYVKAQYNLNDFKNICMHDILTDAEAKKLTTNPRVGSAAVAAYDKNVAAIKQADKKVPLLLSGA